MRQPAFLVYALSVANVIFFAAFFPLAPDIEYELGLSTVEVGALLTAYGAAFLGGSIPAGLVADRIGARTMLIGTSVTLGIAAVGHAVAVDFWSLLVARSLFGLGGATVLIAGLSWLSDSVSDARRKQALAAVVPITGLGGTTGFVLGGAAGDAFGTAAPFFICAALFAATTVGLVLGEHGRRRHHDRQSVREMIQAGRAARGVLAVALLFLLASLSETLVNLLGALQLNANGLSAGGIGAALALGTVLFVAVSLAVARLAERLTRIAALGLTSLLLGASLAPLLVSDSTAAIVTAMTLRSGVFGLVYGIGFPLAAISAIRYGIRLGATNGLLMLSIGVSYTVGPLGGAAIADSIGATWVYGVLVAGCFVGALTIFAAGWADRLAAERHPRRAGR